jgi:predicted TPR repeat methyltransferase
MSNLITSREFFEAKYQDEVDPWHFTDSGYEQSRYAAIIASLQSRFFPRAFEPGCSIGVLTKELAGFCGQLYAMDISETAAQRAAERCKDLVNVQVCQGSLPADTPPDTFDLLVLSEIGYYYDTGSLAELATSLVSRLNHGGVLLAAHWLGNSPDHLLSGDEVHEVIAEIPGISLILSRRCSEFRLDQWLRV